MNLVTKKLDQKSVVIPFRLPKRLHSLVKAYAEAQSTDVVRISQADVLREAVESFFSADRIGIRNDNVSEDKTDKSA